MFYICAIHPWMQGKIDVAPLAKSGWRFSCWSRSSPPRRRPRYGTSGSRPSRTGTSSRTAATRSWGSTFSRPRPSSRRSSTGASRRAGEAAPERPGASVDHASIPGPLIHARVGDRSSSTSRTWTRCAATRTRCTSTASTTARAPTARTCPASPGADADVKAGQTWTYRLTRRQRLGRRVALPRPLAVDDHSIDGGMFGTLSILGRHERAPDREFVVVFAPFGNFMTINGRAFVGNTPVFHVEGRPARAVGRAHDRRDFHTFHVHGHRWSDADGVPRDTQTLGPAESFRVRWREDAPGTWLYHCHVEEPHDARDDRHLPVSCVRRALAAAVAWRSPWRPPRPRAPTRSSSRSARRGSGPASWTCSRGTP